MLIRRRSAMTPHQKLREMQLELHHLEEELSTNRLSATLRGQLTRRVAVLKAQLTQHKSKNTYLQDP